MKFLKTKTKQIMKKVFIAMGAIAAMACSCTKEEIKSEEIPMQEGQINISFVNDVATRASGEGHGEQADDNNINSLEIFIFRIHEGEVDDGLVDGYKKLTGDELKNLSNVVIKTTSGKKMIYAIANSHKTDWSDGITRENVESQMAYLYKEDVRNFVMFASQEVTIHSETTISMVLTRMVSRVKLNSVTVSFAGSPFENSPLQNVKAYLTNVQAQKRLLDGSGTDLKLVNQKKYVPEDMAGITMQGMLYDELAENINETTYSTPHYFYCYENNRNLETDDNRFTRLVIEGTLNGITYYYPIPIKNLRRNSCYTVDVKIYRPGSLDPDKEVEYGTLDLRINVQGWNTLPGTVVEF